MQSALIYIYSLYGALLVPFGTPEFGPKLATGLLFLALLVFLSFLCFALPQAFRLRSALIAIKGESEQGTEQQRRAKFQSDYEEINAALLSNKATSVVWQEFRKTLIFRGNA